MKHDKLTLILLLAAAFAACAGCVDRPSTAATPSTATASSNLQPTSPKANGATVEVSTTSAAGASQKEPQPAASSPPTGRVKNISFDDIKFEMDKEARFERSMLTPAIEQLNGVKIRIRGYILPSFKQEGITNFILVRDNMECCFGPGAALYDCVIVEMTPGNSIEYTVRPIAVEGVFTVQEVVDEIEDRHMAIYHLTADKVK
jgi:hypothetical protein